MFCNTSLFDGRDDNQSNLCCQLLNKSQYIAGSVIYLASAVSLDSSRPSVYCLGHCLWLKSNALTTGTSLTAAAVTVCFFV